LGVVFQAESEHQDARILNSWHRRVQTERRRGAATLATMTDGMTASFRRPCAATKQIVGSLTALLCAVTLG
jgi:hypothetical protein